MGRYPYLCMQHGVPSERVVTYMPRQYIRDLIRPTPSLCLMHMFCEDLMEISFYREAAYKTPLKKHLRWFDRKYIFIPCPSSYVQHTVGCVTA